CWLPCGALLDHCIDDGEELADRGHMRDLGGFAGGAEPPIERLDGGIPADGRVGRHEERGANVRPAAPRGARAAVAAAVAIERGDADEAGDFAAREGPEFA